MTSAMPAIFTTVLLPLAFVAAGVGMALVRNDPAWLVLGAVLAMAASFLARRNNGG